MLLSVRLAILAAILVALSSLPSGRQADAIFHIALLSEIMSGVDGNADAQYVEVLMLFPGQHLVFDTRYSVWNADGSDYEELLLLPDDVPNDGTGVRWIMATQEFVDMTGMSVDFIIPPGMPNEAGMVCWGGPDFAPPSTEWNAEFSFLYTDCVGYGNYPGDNMFHPPPTNLPAGDGTMSLHRIAPEAPTNGSGSVAHLSAPPDLEAWAFACPSPENNEGEIFRIGADDDADGLPNCYEGEEGTDPSVPDSDGDSFNDGEEVDAGSDPLDATSTPAGTAPPGEPPLVLMPSLGDVKGDGTILSTDAWLILNAIADLIPPFDAAYADVNCDGTVDSVDALLILQYTAGYIDSFDACA